ncbi:MAG: hypothetical protein WBQ95_04425, partial [Terracidiphilus sp.]
MGFEDYWNLIAVTDHFPKQLPRKLKCKDVVDIEKSYLQVADEPKCILGQPRRRCGRDDPVQGSSSEPVSNPACVLSNHEPSVVDRRKEDM